MYLYKIPITILHMYVNIHSREFEPRNYFLMPDTSSPSAQPISDGDIVSIYQKLDTAEKTADALEGRLSTLEKRLDELLETLEAQEREDSIPETEPKQS